MNPTLLRHALSLLIVVLLSLVVWLGGEQFRLPRGAIIVGIVTVWAVLTGVSQLLARRGAAQIEASLRQQAAEFVQSARPDRKGEIDDLRRQFETALDTLKRSRRGKTALHSLPVYVLIGPPGSGKTTMLRESSLDFPFMTGRREIRGVGGTRNCDWWFGSRGILLDTAGRFVVENDDREEWLAFLGMVRKARPRRPINGAVIGISITDVVNATDVGLRSLGEQIRERVDELVQHLQIVFPVYLVFTKCDQLAGFVEFFGRFSKEQRKQIWGFTVPFQRGTAAADNFLTEFDDLYRRLSTMRLDHFLSEGPRKDRDKRYTFPLQFALTRQRLADFLAQLQQSNPYQESAPVRGVYFTSGTQERSNLDTLINQLSVAAEVPTEVPKDQRKCYFIDDVFEKVAFADSELAEPTLDADRRRRWARVAGVAAAAVVSASLVYLGVSTWSTQREADQDLKNLATPLMEKFKGPLGPADLEALDHLRARVSVSNDPETTVLRDLLHARLQQSLVRGASEFAAQKVESLKAPSAEGKKYDQLARECTEVYRDGERWLGVHDYFAQTAVVPRPIIGPQMADDALGDGSSVDDERSRKLDAWYAGTKREPEVARDDRRLLDLLAYFDQHPVLRRQVDQITRDHVTRLRNECDHVLEKRWSEFAGLDDDERLEFTYKELKGLTEQFVPDLHNSQELLSKPFTLARAWTTEGEDKFNKKLAQEIEALKRIYVVDGGSAGGEGRGKSLDDLGKRAQAYYRTLALNAWHTAIDAVRVKRIDRGDYLAFWLGSAKDGDSTITEHLAIEYELRFPPVDPAAEPKAPHAEPKAPHAGLRFYRPYFEELDETLVLNKQAKLVDHLTALRAYADRVGKHKETLGLGATGNVPKSVHDSLKRLEAAALDTLHDRWARVAVDALNRAWQSETKGMLDAASERFPFRADAEQDLSDQQFRKLLDVLTLLKDAERFCEESDGGPWTKLALEGNLTNLATRLRCLEKCLNWTTEGIDASLDLRYETNANRFKFEALRVELSEGSSAGEWNTLRWNLDEKLRASIAMLPKGRRSLDLRDVTDAKKNTKPIYQGTWGILRMLRMAKEENTTDTEYRRVQWNFGRKDESIGLIIDLRRSDVVDKILFDPSAFDLPAVPSAFVVKN